jgi:hypothetical protein
MIKFHTAAPLGFYRPVAGRTVKVAAIFGPDNTKAFGDRLDLYNPRKFIVRRKHGDAVRAAMTAH